MTKHKDIKLPKYLKLNKGTMWFDDDPEDNNSSGIRLFDTDVQFVGRGYLSNKDMTKYNETGMTPPKPIQKDKNNNADITHNSYGYVLNEKDNSYFCTEEVPKNKIANILTAFQNKILISYNPRAKKKAPDTKANQDRNFAYEDGDIVFVGKNQDMYHKLQNTNFKDLKKFIEKYNNRSNLQDLLQYEVKGYNKLSRPRGEVMDMIRDRINELGPGISAIRKNDIDDTEES